ncbi:MAG TPA: class I SAM-dependent methyltransferase [Vicinamibacterales bacterium]|nr:class I SAM-dependent methyltransferase [Vicinamibacterales bacterium]
MEGYEGWDDYAPFYDWENARTLGRRDVPFWRALAAGAGGRVLELGCGTGRVTLPLARAGVPLVGLDRSAAMLARARRRVRRSRPRTTPQLVRGDVRCLPFQATGPRARGGFAMVIAPYGLLQSLTRERDLQATLREVHRVLRPGGTFGIELVADVPAWDQHRRRVSLAGWRGRPGGARVTLIESVRQDRRRRLTFFDQEFIERRGRHRRVHRFTLAFRTLSVPEMARRLERAGFEITALLGDYRGRPWDVRAEVWVILARRPAPPRAANDGAGSRRRPGTRAAW